MGSNLSPQAKGYYKRLILVADRYAWLQKKAMKMQIALWLLVTVDVVLAVLYFWGKIVYVG